MTPPNTPKVNFKYLKHTPYKTMDWIGSVSSLVVHTILFIFAFLLGLWGVAWDNVLLVLTTLVSLEAIYLAIFIQMGVNRTTQSLQGVEEDIEEIQEDVQGIQEEVQDLGQEMEDISEDLDEISTEDNTTPGGEGSGVVLNNIQSQLQFLIKEVEILKGNKQQK